MEFQKLIARAAEIRNLYTEREQSLYGVPWNSEEIALGFVGDIGDLAKLVMAENGRRNIQDSREKLEHELSDCLWSVIVLSQLHGIDLEKAFLDTMNELEKHLTGKLNLSRDIYVAIWLRLESRATESSR